MGFLRVVEETTPATPPASNAEIFVSTDATARLKFIDDAGNVSVLLSQTSTDTGSSRLQNKDLDDATTNIVDNGDTTKKLTFSVGGASTATVLTVAEAQTTSQTLNVPNITASSILITDTLAQSITGVKTMTNMTTAAGTTAIPSMTLTSGTNLTSAVAGGVEFDGVQVYETIDTTSGRGAVPVEQYFHLAANGGTISTIANFFGATSNISIVASAYYIIDIFAFFTVTTGTQTVTWTLTNSAAPTSQNILYEMSPVTGIVAPPGTATMLIGQIINDATAAKTIATAALSAANHYAHMKIWLKNGTGTSLKIQATSSANTITPLLGSHWHCRRISPNNIGTFAA